MWRLSIIRKTKKQTHATNNDGPVFIVGCPRSGTTILQAIFAQSFGLFSFPETQLPYRFLHDISWPRSEQATCLKNQRQSLWVQANRYGICRKNSASLIRLAEITAFQEEAPKKKLRKVLLKQAMTDYRAMIDEHAGGRQWVEKSPLNILILPYINRYFKRPFVIHIFRDPVDVAASLVAAAKKHPPFRRFSGDWGWKAAVHLWLLCAKRSVQQRNERSHIFISYNALVAAPERCIAAIGERLGRKPERITKGMELNRIATPDEAWKFERGSEIKILKSRASEVIGKSAIEEIKTETGELYKALLKLAQ